MSHRREGNTVYVILTLEDFGALLIALGHMAMYSPGICDWADLARRVLDDSCCVKAESSA